MNIFIAQIQDNKALLTGEESWHCAKVLRKKPGDLIHLIDGKGHYYDARLDLVSEKQCSAAITAGPRSQNKRNYYLHLAIAPTKNLDRIEWMLEKAVEIGIDEVSFITCKNSERTVLKNERMQKITESAVKQSLQAFIPKISELRPLKELLASSQADQKFIAHCFEQEKTDLKTLSFAGKSTLILIGPEGDFSEEEVELASQQQFKGLSLGQNRLRTETAGLYVCQAVSILS